MASLASPSKLTLVRRYLRFRRKLGYRLRGGELLLGFARLADREAPRAPLTTALAVRWATSVKTARPATHAGRLGMVRGFARYCASIDPRTQIPSSHLLGKMFQRVRPHLFTQKEIKLLMRRTRKLETFRSSLHPLTYETLIGLLASTGMRPGEALRLQLRDLDPERGTLRIASCKFSPQRVIALHPDTVRALQRYEKQRRSLFPLGETFFVNARGLPLSMRRVDRVFQNIAEGMVSRGGRRSLRLMDFRHTFASMLLARWSRQKEPIAHHLLLLARYLGHRSFHSTWWYVSSNAGALWHASERFRKSHS
ncbi:MAG: tyrosine-type recombinase/integrase [Verrucomicrobiales bacterium]|nr:tyrosine-type recombinase/integrase [Verrucomicrobiales bacterium]